MTFLYSEEKWICMYDARKMHFDIPPFVIKIVLYFQTTELFCSLKKKVIGEMLTVS